MQPVPRHHPTTSAPLAGAARGIRPAQAEYSEADELPRSTSAADEIEAALEAFEQRPAIYDPKLRSCAPACSSASIAKASLSFVVAMSGRRTSPVEPRAMRSMASLIPPTPKKRQRPTRHHHDRRPVGRARGDDEEDVIKPLCRTACHRADCAPHARSLRDAVRRNPQVALTALLHKLVRDTFQRTGTSGASLQASVNHVFFREQGRILATSYAKSRSPNGTRALGRRICLWTRMRCGIGSPTLDDTSRLALLAHCVSYGVNALLSGSIPIAAAASPAIGPRPPPGRGGSGWRARRASTWWRWVSADR